MKETSNKPTAIASALLPQTCPSGATDDRTPPLSPRAALSLRTRIDTATPLRGSIPTSTMCPAAPSPLQPDTCAPAKPRRGESVLIRVHSLGAAHG